MNPKTATMILARLQELARLDRSRTKEQTEEMGNILIDIVRTVEENEELKSKLATAAWTGGIRQI